MAPRQNQKEYNRFTPINTELEVDPFLPFSDMSNVLQCSDGPFPSPDEAAKNRLYRFKLHQTFYGSLDEDGVPKYSVWESLEYVYITDQLYRVRSPHKSLEGVYGFLYRSNGLNSFIEKVEHHSERNVTDMRWLYSKNQYTLIYAPHTLFPLKRWSETEESEDFQPLKILDLF